MPTLSPLTLPISLLPSVAGASTSVEVPGLYDVSIAGRGYMIDWDQGQRAYRQDTTNLLRDQADTGSVIGEQSINPEGPWRRTIDSWHGGAGQSKRDQADSVASRFSTSQGIDVWTDGEFSLLKDSDQSLSSTSTNLPIAVAGTRVYVGDGNDLKYSADPFAASPTWTTVTGTPAAAITDITSDGFQVYVGYGASGIYETDTSVGSASSWVTGTVAVTDWVRGRLMAGNGPSIYNPTTAVGGGPAALPTALFTHRNADFDFVGFAESLSHIYAAGYSGDKSEIYSITIQPEGTALAAPTLAGVLPDGEVISSIYGYLGFVLIGTSRGVRFAVPNETTGNLSIGALIETGQPVRDFEGQGKFVWFTWDEHSSLSTGLGRLDLSTIENDGKLQPAYATDLFITSSADVLSVATFSDKRIYTVSGAGVYVESDDLVATGTMYSGEVTYSLSERKTTRDHLLSADFTDGGSVIVSLSSDGGSYTSLGTVSSSGVTKLLTDEISGVRLQTLLTVSRDGTDTTKGPTVYSETLRAFPSVSATKYISATILLRRLVYGHNGTELHFDVEGECDNLDALWQSQQVTTFQRGSRSWPVIVSNLSFVGEPPDDPADPVGALEIQMKVVT